MISARRVAQLAKKWQRMAALGRKRLTVRAKQDQECCSSMAGKGHCAMYTADGSRFEAVALLSNSDASALYRCGIRVYQDTLYAKSNRQFYRDCRISGTVDFIFGDATTVFQHCDVVARLPLRGQQNTITAQSLATAASATGFSFQDCNIYADDDLLRGAPAGGVETYLGR
uniref:Pectinesterase n=1 Tax=Oryza rufipogon TaxID=4529 RepID=A0A0E0QUK4_ORYRU